MNPMQLVVPRAFFRACVLALVITGTQGVADTRFQVIGVSSSHIALRELTSGTSCCGSPEPVNCRYPGLKQLSKKLSPLASPYDQTHKTLVKIEPLGTSIHFIPWKPNQWTRPPGADNPSAREFPIYPLATERERCASPQQAEKTLAKAKAFAKEVGIDFQLESQIQSERLTTQYVNFGRCVGAKISAECDNPYFQIKRYEELSYQVIWKKSKQQAWASYSNNDQFMIAPLLLLSSPGVDVKVYQLSEIVYGMAGVRELPRFLVEPSGS